MKILITGAAGRLGRQLTRHLEPDHELLLGDVTPLADPRFVPLDVRDAEAVRAAVHSCEAIIHLAILDWPPCSAEESLPYGVPALQVHVIGTQNLLHAAWEAKIRQFVHVSSVSVVDGLPPEVVVNSDTRHYSNWIYGLTKGFGEDLCRMFHYSLGLPVAVLRLGSIYLPEAEGYWVGNVFTPYTAPAAPLGPGTSRVHVDDVLGALRLAVEHPAPGYALVHVVGADSGHRWDLQAARKIYGWQPRYAFGPDGHPREVSPRRQA